MSVAYAYFPRWRAFADLRAGLKRTKKAKLSHRSTLAYRRFAFVEYEEYAEILEQNSILQLSRSLLSKFGLSVDSKGKVGSLIMRLRDVRSGYTPF